MVEQRLHADAQSLVVAVDAGPVSRLAAPAGAADAGQDRGDDVVAEGEQGGDGSGSLRRDVVTAGSAGFVREALPAQFPEVIGGLPGGVAVVAGEVPDLGGELGGGEPAGCRGQGERGGQGRPDPRLVQVDPGDPAGPGLGRQRQLIQHPVRQEAGVGAVPGRRRTGPPCRPAG